MAGVGRPRRRRRRVTVLALAAAVALGALGGVARAQGPDPVQRARDTVLEQLAAFRRGDFDAAYAFASAMIHQMFDRQSFESMVRGGYPEIARSSHATIAATEAGPSGSVYVFVTVVGDNGRIVEARYELVLEDGGFKVNGVITRPAPASSA